MDIKEPPTGQQIMYKNRNITDFFKPFALSRFPKRLREPDDLEHISVPLPQRSASPKLEVTALPTNKSSSSLSSLGNDDSVEDGLRKSRQCTVESAGKTVKTNGPLLASSQRVTRNGQVMIQNSDGEYDSDESLADIDDILAVQRPAFNPSPSTDPDLPSMPTGPSTQSSQRNGTGRSARRLKTERLTPPLPMTTKYKFSLESLVTQAKKNEAAEAETAQARQLIGTLDDQRAALEVKLNRCKEDLDLNKELLVTVVESHGGDDNIDRLMHAIERTEALHTQISWSFFHTGPTKHGNTTKDLHSVESTGCLNRVIQGASEQRTPIVNGFLGELAAKSQLSDDVLSWIMGTSYTEPSESLRGAYIDIIVNARRQIKPLLSPSLIDELFRSIGATDEALDLARAVVPVLQVPDHRENNTPNRLALQHILRLLAGTAEWMDCKTRIRTLSLFFRLLLDITVVTDRETLETLGDAIEHVILSVPAGYLDDEIMPVIEASFFGVTDAQLRLHLLNHIPATLPRLSLLRRALSLAFFFDDPIYLNKKPMDLLDFKQIMLQLKKPQFAIARDTDYTKLAAMMGLLDIGLDDGDPPDSSLDLDLENDYNKKVEKLANVVRSMFTKIVDSGASHMSRTEAKDSLEAFHSRIIYAVRTKPKAKRLLVGSENAGGAYGMSKEQFMAKFLTKQKVALEISPN